MNYPGRIQPSISSAATALEEILSIVVPGTFFSRPSAVRVVTRKLLSFRPEVQQVGENRNICKEYRCMVLAADGSVLATVQQKRIEQVVVRRGPYGIFRRSACVEYSGETVSEAIAKLPGACQDSIAGVFVCTNDLFHQYPKGTKKRNGAWLGFMYEIPSGHTLASWLALQTDEQAPSDEP